MSEIELPVSDSDSLLLLTLSIIRLGSVSSESIASTFIYFFSILSNKLSLALRFLLRLLLLLEVSGNYLSKVRNDSSYLFGVDILGKSFELLIANGLSLLRFEGFMADGDCSVRFLLNLSIGSVWLIDFLLLRSFSLAR